MTPGEGEGKNESVAPVWQRADGEGRPRETEPLGSELRKVNAGRLDTHTDAQTQGLVPRMDPFFVVPFAFAVDSAQCHNCKNKN